MDRIVLRHRTAYLHMGLSDVWVFGVVAGGDWMVGWGGRVG